MSVLHQDKLESSRRAGEVAPDLHRELAWDLPAGDAADSPRVRRVLELRHRSASRHHVSSPACKPSDRYLVLKLYVLLG